MNTKNAKILIVENEKDLSEALMTVLMQQGYMVVVADEGETGLKLALSEKPDLILLDLMMPKMDGLTLLSHLRQDAWGKTARVVIMTAFDDMDKMTQAVEAGVEDYIVKTNVTLAKVVEKVQEKLAQ